MSDGELQDIAANAVPAPSQPSPGQLEATDANVASQRDGEAAPATGNPLGSGFGFNLHMPELEVRMVNAATLGDYETWLYSASLSFSAVVGFAVAYIQSFHTDSSGSTLSDPVYLIVAIIFLALFVVFVVQAAIHRHALKAGTRTYKMRAIGDGGEPS